MKVGILILIKIMNTVILMKIAQKLSNRFRKECHSHNNLIKIRFSDESKVHI